MRNFKLPKKAKRFLVPGVLLLSLFLLVGGLYFRSRSMLFSSQSVFPEEEEGAVSGMQTGLPAGRQGLPQNFPPDVPLFEPAEILSTLESQERIQLTLQTETAAARVLQFYQKEMIKTGWRLTGRGAANDNGVLTFLKDGRHTQLIIASEPENGPTLIILSITP